MTEQRYMTYEQTMALISQTRPSHGLLADFGAIARDVIGQTGVDGHITLGDVVKAFGVTGFFTIVTPVGTTGLGLCLNVLSPSVPVFDFMQLGAGLGAMIGAVLGGVRLAKDYCYVPTDDNPAPEQKGPEPKGLRIFVRRGYSVLLPDVKRAIIEDMVEATARLYFSGGSKNFSKVHLGKPWGKHLNDAKKTLVKINYVRPVQNNTYVFTNAARQWLADYY